MSKSCSEWALQQPGADPVAAYGFGNYFYDRKRHEDAITCWERVGGRWRVFRHGVPQSRNRAFGTPAAMATARSAILLQRAGTRSADPRLVSEYDQLCAKLNDPLDRAACVS